jgi:hypothetical protein
MVVAQSETAFFESLGRVMYTLYTCIHLCRPGNGDNQSRLVEGFAHCDCSSRWPRPRRLFRGSHVDATYGVPYKPRHLRACAPKSAQPGLFRARWRRQLREKNLPTEQIGAQTPPRLSRPHGDQGRSQGCGGAAVTRTQAAQCVTGAFPVRASFCYGAVEATSGLSRCRRRNTGCRQGVSIAGAPARRRRWRACRLYGVATGRQRRGTQPRAAALAGARTARGGGKSARRPRLCAGRTAGHA